VRESREEIRPSEEWHLIVSASITRVIELVLT
jgi:hypothetical protein